VGWQVMMDGMEITQFTYFQQCGGLDLDPICAELTYGLERICASSGCGLGLRRRLGARPGYRRGSDLWRCAPAEELQYSVYNFEEADVDRLWEHFNSYEAEAQALLTRPMPAGRREGEAAGEAALPAHLDL
jgi:glycyl-tRNA synthetase alpha chain